MTTELKEKLKKYSLVRFMLVGHRFFRRMFWQLRGYVRLNSIRRRKNEIWLELGAGSKKGSGKWVTIDINGQCDIYYNLAHGIPFSDESVSRIYSSHVFEHLTPAEASLCLRECLRVLKKGGEFSIAVPNARLYVDAYLKGRLDGANLEVATPIDYLNYTAYCEGHHKAMFDQESLVHLLRSSGLTHVTLRGFDPSVDLEIRRWESIYAKGYKGIMVPRQSATS
jgi:SAM-dependent methyltransferase